MTHTSVRAKAVSNRDEKVIEFCDHSDSIIREYETCEDAVTFIEQEKRWSFYHAVARIIPEFRSADLMIQTQMIEMNSEEI